MWSGRAAELLRAPMNSSPVLTKTSETSSLAAKVAADIINKARRLPPWHAIPAKRLLPNPAAISSYCVHALQGKCIAIFGLVPAMASTGKDEPLYLH